MDQNEILAQMQGDLKAFVAKSQDEQKTFGSVLAETKAQIEKLQGQLDTMEANLQRARTAATPKTFIEELKENESFSRLMRDRQGTAILTFNSLNDFDRKTTITSTAVGSATSGVLTIERTPGIVPEARRIIRLRDLLTSVPTTQSAIDYVKVNSFSKVVSPQTEASAKGESEMLFTTATANVKTIATWIPATAQVLDDMEGLGAFLQSSLRYAIDEEVEDQILSGNNTSNNLNGLTNQATSFNTGLLVAADGWKKVDIIGRAIQQIEVANEYPPNFVVLHPTDAWGMRLTKTTTGEYIFGDPTNNGASNFFGLTPIVTTAMSSGYFLVGSSAPTCAVVRERMPMQIAISTEHDTYFTKNMVAIRAECRLTLVVFRPAAYIYGALNTSP